LNLQVVFAGGVDFIALKKLLDERIVPVHHLVKFFHELFIRKIAVFFFLAAQFFLFFFAVEIQLCVACVFFAACSASTNSEISKNYLSIFLILK
jgi:hypothetical protein